MYAVIAFAGHQYKVQAGDVLDVNYVDAEVGTSVDVEEVLAMFDEAGKLELGTPTLSGKNVQVKVLEHLKGDKVRVYKMKSKKRYRRNKSFRPTLTKIEILPFADKKTPATKAAPKKATAKKDEPTKEKAAK